MLPFSNADATRIYAQIRKVKREVCASFTRNRVGFPQSLENFES